MNRKRIYEINVERLTRWKERLTESHATAQVIVGVTHEGGQHESGRVVVQTTEDIDDYKLLLLVREAARQLEQIIATKQ